jgi:hypothetical protein
MEEVVKVLTNGAKKYGDGNWKSVENKQPRYFAAAMRHMVAWQIGDEIDDPESGHHHLAHAICHLLFLMCGEIDDERDVQRGF